MHRRSQFGFALLVFACFVVVFAVAVWSGVLRHDDRTHGATPTADPTLQISIGERTLSVPPGTTVHQALHRAGVTPGRGALLDVLGNVIEPSRVPGHVEIDGESVPMTAAVTDGDHLTLVAGKDRTESTMRERQNVAGRQPGDPEFTLSTWHLTRIDRIGRAGRRFAARRDTAAA